MNTIDKYLGQALDSYPHWLESTIESLEFALAHDENNTSALCLYARVQSEQFMNYDVAISYFEQALAIDIKALQIYPFFIKTLILNEDYMEAEKLIAFSLKLKGTNKVEVLLNRMKLLEIQKEFKAAMEVLKDIQMLITDFEYNTDIEEAEKRIKLKIKLATSQKLKIKKLEASL